MRFRSMIFASSFALRLFCAGVIAVTAADMASAAPVFSRVPGMIDGGTGSDRDFGTQIADDVTLTSAATVRSVKWWGMFGPFNNTPVTPVSFDLIFYGDIGGSPSLPNVNNVLSSTTVSFSTLTDTGINAGNVDDPLDVYVFEANVTPTAIPANTKVWFSVLANTNNDLDDDFLWAGRNTGNSTHTFAYLTSSSAPNFTTQSGTLWYFVLDNAALIPEPSSLVLLSLGGLCAVARCGKKRRRGA
jgi:hypothetical protein